MKDPTLFQVESHLHQSSDIGMYYCGKRIDTPNHIYGPEIRNYYLFVLVNKGEASFFHRSGTIKLKAQDMLVMCPGERIHYAANTPWSIQWVGLYGQTVESYMEELSIDGDHPIIQIEEYNEMSRVLEDLYLISIDSDECCKFKQLELIYRFFSLLSPPVSKHSKYDIAESAKRILDYNFGRDIRVQEISNTLHVDAAYLTRKFSAKYGIAPKEYLLDKRIAHAKKLLKESDACIKEIAASIGYFDQLYFSRIFKKKVGVSPTDFAKKYKASK